MMPPFGWSAVPLLKKTRTMLPGCQPPLTAEAAGDSAPRSVAATGLMAVAAMRAREVPNALPLTATAEGLWSVGTD